MRRVSALVVAALIILALIASWRLMIAMPGRSFRGQPPPLDASGIAIRDALRRDVQELAGRIGERNTVLPERMHAAADYVAQSLSASGLQPRRQTFEAEAVESANIEVEIRGATMPAEIIVVGAHYDSVDDSPGADDNASGTAALLSLARIFATRKPHRTIRFVAFANEEPPHFQTAEMGSVVYARRCAERRERIVAMLSLESIGYFSDAEGSQAYPPLLASLYPSRGDFIAFAANVKSHSLVRRCIRSFRSEAKVASEGAALPELIPQIGWSDQWSFWRAGYPAIMITDTAPFRNPHYHTPGDTPVTLDYDRFTRVVQGLVRVIDDLSQ